MTHDAQSKAGATDRQTEPREAPVPLLAQVGIPEGWETVPREEFGRMFYMALHGHQGAIWEANEHQEIWHEAGDRLRAMLSARPKIEDRRPGRWGYEMTDFTPGPWRAMSALPIVTRDATGFYPADPTGNVEICRVGSWPDKEIRPYNQDRWMADARLISAAPDLLAACEEFSREYDGFLDGDGHPCPTLAKARAAIAKATPLLHLDSRLDMASVADSKLAVRAASTETDGH